MSDAGKKSVKQLLVTVLGGLFILAGILFNPWLIARLINVNLATPSRVIILVADILLIGFGVLLLSFRKNNRMRSNLITMLISIVVTLLIAEGALHIFWNPQPGFKLFTDNPDKTGSYVLKPNLDLSLKNNGEKIEFQTNSFGMRWGEVSIDNPLNKQRVAFIGDSFTMGLWADRTENTFAGVFNSLIDKDKYEVLNFGVGGYGLPDEQLQLQEKVLQFKPDYIFLMVFNGNDFSDTYLGKDKYIVKSGNADWNKPNFLEKIPAQYVPPYILQSEHKTVTQKIGSFFSNLYTYQLFRTFTNAVFGPKTPVDVSTEPKYIDFSVDPYFTSYTFWSQAPYTDIALKVKDSVLSSLDNIKKICADNSIKLVIVSIPYEEQVYANAMTGPNYDLNYPQKYLEEYSQANSIPYLNLLPSLRSYVRDNNLNIYFPGTTHFNNAGHAITGKLLNEFFNDNVLGSSGPK